LAQVIGYVGWQNLVKSFFFFRSPTENAARRFKQSCGSLAIFSRLLATSGLLYWRSSGCSLQTKAEADTFALRGRFSASWNESGRLS